MLSYLNNDKIHIPIKKKKNAFSTPTTKYSNENKQLTSDQDDLHAQQKQNPQYEQSTLLHPSSLLIMIEQFGH